MGHTVKQREQRNLNPHAEAIAAMYLYGAWYAAQRGGSMDFWDGLNPEQHQMCRELVIKIKEARVGTNEDKSL